MPAECWLPSTVLREVSALQRQSRAVCQQLPGLIPQVLGCAGPAQPGLSLCYMKLWLWVIKYPSPGTRAGHLGQLWSPPCLSCGLVFQAGSSRATLWALPSQTRAECRQYMTQEHPNQSVCHSCWASASVVSLRNSCCCKLGGLATVLGPTVHTPGSCGCGKCGCSRMMVLSAPGLSVVRKVPGLWTTTSPLRPRRGTCHSQLLACA